MTQYDFTDSENWPVTDCTEVHFGLIPVDPARNADQIEPRYIQHATPAMNIGVFTNGDSWVEWGEDRTYDPELNQDGRQYGAPGLHVAVRFPPLAAMPEATTMKPEWYNAWERSKHLAGRAKAIIEEEFADLLANGYRIGDYACLSDATDWSEPPTWDKSGRDQSRLVTFYA